MPARTPNPFDAMSDSFEFLQKFWGGMAPGAMPGRLTQPIPSMLAPTVDLAELDQRITDLRAVEKWLEINAGMLRTTIQTLEVQRATIATLKGIGGAMLAPMMAQAAAPTPTRPPEEPRGLPPAEPPPAAEHSKRKRAASAAPPLADDALNPAAWWNTLQEQFSRIAATATEAATPPAKAKKATAKKRARR
jgi:hypothetical protein